MSNYKDSLTPEQLKSVHARIFVKAYDQTTGKPVQKPYIQVFSVPEFKTFEKHHKSLGFEIQEMLHDPRTKKDDPDSDAAKVELEKARKEYEGLFNKAPHAQKSAETLRKEIAEFHEYQNVLKEWQNVMKVKTTPTLSMDEMIDDIRRLRKKEETVQQTADRETEEIKKAEKEKVEERAKTQKSEESEEKPE